MFHSTLTIFASIAAVKLALQKRPLRKPCTECINERLYLCLCNNSSKLDRYHLLQTNFTKKREPNSCSYSDLAVYRLDKLITNEQINNFSELFFHGKYKDNYFVI